MTSDVHHFAAAYALDALDADEREAFEEHYSDCEICRSDVGGYREAAAALGSLAATPPSGDLRSRLLAEISETRQLSPLASAGGDNLGPTASGTVVGGAENTTPGVTSLSVRRRRRLMVGVASAAAAVLAVVGVFALRDDPSPSKDADLVALLSAPDTTLERLVGTVGGDVSVAWSTSRDEVVVAGVGLGDPGAGRAYALWMLDGASQPVASILFTPDDDGTATAAGPLPGSPNGWGITIEDAKGAATPTGEIIFLTS